MVIKSSRFIPLDISAIILFNDEKQYFACKDDILADSGTKEKFMDCPTWKEFVLRISQFHAIFQKHLDIS